LVEVRSSWPLWSRAGNVLQCKITIGSDEVNSAQHPKLLRGSDRRLQLVYVKVELGVIAHQHGAVNHNTVVVLTAHHGLEGRNL